MKSNSILIVMALVLTSLVLTACYSDYEELSFKDKTDHWEVEYFVSIRGGDSENVSLIMEYIGEGEPPENISYSVDGVTSSSMAENRFMSNGVLNISVGSCVGCQVTQEDAQIDVSIRWEDNNESMVLELED
ncbi:hypothetical protein [Alkalibacillus haloalkaliphilus]|uniref:Lipoprotein n=1 Tax=Alkalibacillus haloalkaliphilus TaxID=94136 RepID=A0A511W3S0_9BACI|nr:hypothetical protein [Alkalibacillus haloalkaliphilus]GEN45411.1 hypothetical protein AHA02nite_11870 [Alkalibacillus haloalkaliphilus]